MKKGFILTFALGSFYCQAQTDTSRQLQSVQVNAYFESQPLLHATGSIGIIDQRKLSEWNDYSLVPSLNSIPGVRMEERSPGSYRLSIRGSLLRSPFGIRNVKIYLGDFPLTDAGGNTYLNLLDPGTLNRIEVLRGPEAAGFGANSGGVLLINPVSRTYDSSFVSAGVSAGSYGMHHEKVQVQQLFNHYRINIAGGYQHSDGYRENSASERQYLQLYQQLNYDQQIQVKALFIMSNLNYRTPGGLTLDQFNANPRAARYATATLPGALQQKAGVIDQTVYGGLSVNMYFTPNIKQNITIFGSHTNFENPFITNYEMRTENSAGIRSYLEINNNLNTPVNVKWQAGLESQRTGSRINNFGNRGGERDTIQAADEVIADQYFYFTRLSLLAFKRFTFEAGLSLNFYQYSYRSRLTAMPGSFQNNAFDPQLMPRVGLSYLFTSTFSWRVSASRGYSAPTIAEIRPSDNIVYTNLQPEQGWNYETGIRVQHSRWSADVALYYYKLRNAIVRRTTEAGTEYFINSGGTTQMGVETQLTGWIIEPGNHFIRSLQLWDSYTFSHFTFDAYSNAGSDYSGNRLTGVPQQVNVIGMNMQLPLCFFWHAQYNYTAAIPLNDMNSVYAHEYHLVQLKGGWKKQLKKITLEWYAGIDNLLNQSYSLGNDLNAAGGRYYNPAPLRNYFAGFAIAL